MMYFHLNTSNYIDTTVDGKQNIGLIEISFFCHAFNSLSEAKASMCNWSEDPVFAYEPALKGEKWVLCSVDDESVGTGTQELLELMEKAHTIILPDFGKSLIDLGLHYDFITQIPNRKIEAAWADHLAENNLQYVEEVVCGRNMSLTKKINQLALELIKIGSEGNQLTIVDPYIFPKRHDGDYDDLFLGIIRKAKVSSVKIITDKGKVDAETYDSICSKLSIKMSVYYSTEYHDRWWIIESKKAAIMCGTSLNGFGKGKPSTITTLPEHDVLQIIADISEVCK